MPSTMALNKNGTWTLRTLPAIKRLTAVMTRILTPLLPFGQMFVASCLRILQSVQSCFFAVTGLETTSVSNVGDAGVAFGGAGGAGFDGGGTDLGVEVEKGMNVMGFEGERHCSCGRGPSLLRSGNGSLWRTGRWRDLLDGPARAATPSGPKDSGRTRACQPVMLRQLVA